VTQTFARMLRLEGYQRVTGVAHRLSHRAA
jgi:hypothetical protein